MLHWILDISVFGKKRKRFDGLYGGSCRNTLADSWRGDSDVAESRPDFRQHQWSTGGVLLRRARKHQCHYIGRVALCVAVSAC